MRCLRGKSRGISHLCRVAVYLVWLLGNWTLNAQPLRFRATVTHENNPLSAILIVKEEGGVLKGSMINEFGVNLVEFTVKKGKTKIVRLNPMLKRPFIKKVLRKDFALLAAVLQRDSDETLWSKGRGMFQASCSRSTDSETHLISLHIAHRRIALTIDLHQF